MIRIEIKTDNAAFERENGHLEIGRILRELAQRIENVENYHVKANLKDSNGNTVGFCEFTEDRS